MERTQAQGGSADSRRFHPRGRVALLYQPASGIQQAAGTRVRRQEEAKEAEEEKRGGVAASAGFFVSSPITSSDTTIHCRQVAASARFELRQSSGRRQIGRGAGASQMGEDRGECKDARQLATERGRAGSTKTKQVDPQRFRASRSNTARKVATVGST